MAKRIGVILMIGTLTLLFPIYLFAEVLFSQAYEERLDQCLSRAKDSITVAMYFIILEPSGQGPVTRLTDDLIAAKNRGVKVKVVLEDSKLKENCLAYRKLKENGIDVRFDTPDRLLHAKGVSIDNRWIFIGSANWSKAAIEANYEATSFLDSPQDAAALKSYVEAIPVQDVDIFLPPQAGVPVPLDFLLSASGGRTLIQAEAEKQLQLYLLLRELSQNTGAKVIKADYESLAKEMGYSAPHDLGKYRNPARYYYDRIHHSLKRLARYGLISYLGRDISFSAMPASGASVIIPLEYWSSGLSRTLSPRAQYCYLIALYESGRSTKYPFWFRSQADMTRLYGISDTTLTLGFRELEDNGLISIERGKLDPAEFSNREANTYKMLPLKQNKS